ncbi:hypothetical protein ACQY0O_000728 [Thecaphora frezii]
MDDQYFSSAHSGSTFDFGSNHGCAPMGFSPSIDSNGGLPFTLSSTGLETPSTFLVELQRKRTDTITTIKPDYERDAPLEVDEDGIEIDIPVRKRALQRLSLASSIASSAPSTGTSDLDGLDLNGFESESDARSSASPAGELTGTNGANWGIHAAQNFADLPGSFATPNRIPDLVHWRSNTTIQASFYQRHAPSPAPSSTCAETYDALGQSTDFSFAEFIDEDPRVVSQDEERAILETAQSAQAMSIGADGPSQDRPTLALANSTSSTSSSSASASASLSAPSSIGAPSTPIKQEPAHPLHAQLSAPHAPGLGLFSHGPGTRMCNEPTPHACSEACPSQGTAPFAIPAGYPVPLPHQSPVPGSDSNWSMPRPMHPANAATASHPQAFLGQPMVFSQSAPTHPVPNMAMYGAGLMASPVPSSPAFSARSSSPYPTSVRPGYPGSPSVLSQAQGYGQSPMHGVDPVTGSPMTKAQQLVAHLNNMWNPYAGLITKRSRGRRVPSKPEEMNNLGKSGKVYTCKVPGCGKCFKRSEHLKRHVRSIHTDDKPFVCPFPTCHKRFSRHDNLNQHARVHATTSGTTSRGMPGPLGQPIEDGTSPYPVADGEVQAQHAQTTYGLDLSMQVSGVAIQDGYFGNSVGATDGELGMAAAMHGPIKAETFVTNLADQ